MKRRRISFGFAVLVAAAMVSLAGCGGTPAAAAAPVPEQKIEAQGKAPLILDHAGRALGSDTIPKWLQVYNTGRSVTAVEAMPEYRQDYCFVAEDTGTNLKAVQAWLNTVQINDLIGARISTRVGSTAEANVTTTNNEEYSNFLNNVMTVTRDATYTGFAKNSDYWVQWRIYDPDDESKYKDEYTAYILYTIRRDQLNEQIANQFRQIQNNAKTAEEREMWNGLIQAVLEKGLGVEAKTPPPANAPIIDINATVY